MFLQKNKALKKKVSLWQYLENGFAVKMLNKQFKHKETNEGAVWPRLTELT